MLILNCTKAAADFFSKTKKGAKISPIETAADKKLSAPMIKANRSKQWQWLIHAIKVKGKNVLVMMDYQTRFSITLTGVKKGEDATFLDMFEHHLIIHIHELMTNIDAEPQAIEASLENYRNQHFTRTFYLRGDRSVQSHINDVAWHFRQYVSGTGSVPTGVDLISQDVFVNQLLRMRKGGKEYFTPHHEFLFQWLTHYAEHSDAQASACIALLEAKEKAEFEARHPELFITQPENADTSANQNTIIPKKSDLKTNTQNPETNHAKSNVIYLDAHRKK